MKHSLFLVAIGVCMIFFAACKKQGPDLTANPSAGDSGIHISLTGPEARALMVLMKKDGVKDSVDFLQKVWSVRSVTNKRPIISSQVRPMDYPPGSDAPGEDEFGDAFLISGPPNLVVDVNSADYPWDVEAAAVYKGVYSRVLTFTIRGNQVKVNIPYCVAVGYADPNTWQVLKVYQGTNMLNEILPVGGNWGTVTQTTINNWLTNYGTNSGLVHAEAQEVRTEVISTMGTVKISTSADLEIFKVGTELSAGFTVQSATNIYNQYTLSGQINVDVTGLFYGGIPVFTPSGVIIVTDTGILLN